MKLSPNDIISMSHPVTQYISLYSIYVSKFDCANTMIQLFHKIYFNFIEYIRGKVIIDIHTLLGYQLTGSWYGYSL